MPGPTPKKSSTRQRRNKHSTAARLETDEPIREKAPPLGRHPERKKWNSRTKTWWTDVWESPMAQEYVKADIDGLRVLAALVDQFWKDPHNTKLASEIRLQRQCFGLTPLDRRRLQWEIARTEQAEKRSQKSKAPKRSESGGDPRRALKAI